MQQPCLYGLPALPTSTRPLLSAGAPTAVAAPTLSLDGNGGVKFTFTPATPDAAISYQFVLASTESAVVRFDSADIKAGTSAGTLEYTWASAPSGALKGWVRCVPWLLARSLAWLVPRVHLEAQATRGTLRLEKDCWLPVHCRSINGVGSVTSAESASLDIGQPGQPGKPKVQSGATGFVVSFTPGEGG